MNDLIKTCCMNYEDEFVKKMLPMPFVAKGILASEGFAFCALAKCFGISLILESGVCKGQSTHIWSKFSSSTKVIAVDKVMLEQTIQKFNSIPNVSLQVGNGKHLLPLLVRRNPEERIAIFIDGPKGMDAVDLAKQCLEFENVYMIGMHDFHNISKGAPNIRRIKLDEMNIADFYTDDPEFLKHYSYMDSNENFTGQGDEDHYWFPYWLMSKRRGKIATFGSYGPTIAFILRR